jgi:hypothetical protein
MDTESATIDIGGQHGIQHFLTIQSSYSAGELIPVSESVGYLPSGERLWWTPRVNRLRGPKFRVRSVTLLIARAGRAQVETCERGQNHAS